MVKTLNRMHMSKLKTAVPDEHAFTAEDLANENVQIGIVGDEQEAEIDAALDLHAISIRLPKKLLEELKFIAKLNNIGYQPLIRNHLEVYVAAELKFIMQDFREFQTSQAKVRSEVVK
jgi:predicted DNA binding CopG/RHH family protein